MASGQMTRPALGQVATLGTLYDARRDNFLPHTVLAAGFGDDLVTQESVGPKQETVISNGTLVDAFDKMEVSHELGASLLSEFVRVRGSARYLLTPDQDTALTVHRALHYTFTVCKETLKFSGQELQDYLTLDEVPNKASATHVVSGITWGARCIVAAERKLVHEKYRASVVQEIETAFDEWEETNEWDDNGNTTSSLHGARELGQVSVYSDLAPDDPNVPDGTETAYRHVMQLPQLVQKTDGGKGRPLSYTLVPISFLAMLTGQSIPAAIASVAISAECQERMVDLVDNLRLARGMICDYRDLLNRYQSCVSPNHMREVSRFVTSTADAEQNLRMQYGALVPKVRAGIAAARDIWKLIDTTVALECTVQTVRDLASKYVERFSLFDIVTSRGGLYVGYRGSPRTEFERIHQEDSWGDCCVLYFDDAALGDTVLWTAHVKILIELLDDEKSLQRHSTRIFAVDCTATGLPLDELSIWKYRRNTLVTANLLKQRSYLANKCLMRHNPRSLDASYKDKPWPARRKMVKIPCPGHGPNCKQDHCWICYMCHMPVEYAVDDNCMYCECGRVPCEEANFLFNCQKPGHVPAYAQYATNLLRRTMKNLEAPPEVNILILGESGVGKSTFINAFINYLTCESLEHAMSIPDLNWIISCSFGLLATDPVTGAFSQRVIQIGPPSADEKNGVRGHSATQKATAYPVYFGGKLVRLIDTPGIGDTRGIEQDRANMRHTLSVLKNYTALHGIMILLKPTSTRTGVMFRFCINELLSHLHRDATRNIVFGFTNTRASMYTPGDALGPLMQQIEHYGTTLSALNQDTVYCFDSESFRYLAAKKQDENIDLGSLGDYSQSWKHSAAESQRLIRYLEGRTPHSLKDTVGLAETRDLITRLVEPMAHMIRTVSKSIEDSKIQMEALTTTQDHGTKLRSMMNLQKTTFTMLELDEPYTVCNHPKCCTFKEDHEGRRYEIRKTYCHEPCFLTDLETGKAGVDGIAGCATFRGTQTCKKCSHPPIEHLHVKFLYNERTETVKDPVVQAKLKANASDVQIKQAGLSALKRQIDEFEHEKSMIEDAQAEFSWYLEENAITVYNNVTIEYLDHQIKNEKAKSAQPDRQGKAIIEALELSKKKHETFVTAMREGKRTKGSAPHRSLDADGVERLIDKLCAMQHFGKQFRDARDAVQNAYLKQFRETPFRVRKAEPYMGGAGTHNRGKRPQTHHSAGAGPSRSSHGWHFATSSRADKKGGAPPDPDLEISSSGPVWPDASQEKVAFSMGGGHDHDDSPPPYAAGNHVQNWNAPRRPYLAAVGRKLKRIVSRFKIS